MRAGGEPDTVPRQVFDRLFAEGCAAVSSGRHARQRPPVEDGNRWGCSAILRPDADAAEVLDEVAREAADAAGGRQWITGSAGSAHLTVRSLERWRRRIDADDPVVRRYAAALAAAAEGVGPLTFAVTGLTLTPTSVLACARPSDGAADRLAAAYADALGPDGWHEHGFNREFWYLSLMHFADAVEHPDRLIGWVAERRDLGIATVVADEVQLIRWRFADCRMLPDVLAVARFR